ncbi:Palmitoyltransferase [Caenorhabditis elegans]|uniref:Palmitoyltransferase n=1 Tax=Caenorhabditis elegans TaxID=6239 RepID=Q93828_CAEEL|nr:Palmitoyltransferase [Caenorhabditis elegans]CAB01873.2 Palmitoyltransferase [Caenorhabditis elegans]|eukprot:NP_492753.2 Palmitoyltransferase [Caenorhabditis elegans]
MDVCRIFNRIVYFLVEKSLGDISKFDPFDVLKLVALWGGRLCLLIFVGTLCNVTYVVIFKMIPVEWNECQNMSFFVFRFVLLIYIYYSVVFHYYKARTLTPVVNPGTPSDSFCIKCNNWKGPSTSHCKACDKCIYRMDHHCPHIGQCVGAHNQSHFFLFLFYLQIATGLFFLMATTFWMKWIETRKELTAIPDDQCWPPYCFNRYYYLITRSQGTEDTMVKFAFFLFVTLHWIMWGFVGVYVGIISFGLTMAMKMFQKSDAESRKPFTWFTIKARWRKYMNCQDEPLWKIFFIPKTRKIVSYNDYKELIM